MSTSLRDDVGLLRTGVGLVRHERLRVHILRDPDAISRMEGRLPARVSNRDGDFKQGLLLDDAGRPLLDLLAGYVMDDMLIVSRGLDADETSAELGETVDEDWVIFGVEGPYAWELMAAWDSPGIIGLPYLGAFSPSADLYVIRAGFTGEYGYLLLVRPSRAEAIWRDLCSVGESLDARPVRLESVRHCSLENWVFDPFRDGGQGFDALELQLRWRVDLHSDARGVSALREHKASGLRRRVTAMTADEGVSVGAAVQLDGTDIGTVMATVPDLFGTTHRLLAMVQMPYAQAGVDAYRVEGRPCRTHAAPWVLNHSLYVNPQKHSYARRQAVVIPEVR